jgi:anti-anti-sigma factor
MDESELFSIFDVAADDGTRVVNVAGEVDMGTGPAFQRGLLRAIGASRGGLIVDLTRASFLDSSALTSLVNAFDELRQKSGGSLAIVATDPRMRALFEVARLERDFLIFSTRGQALAALAPMSGSETLL